MKWKNERENSFYLDQTEEGSDSSDYSDLSLEVTSETFSATNGVEILWTRRYAVVG